MNFEELYKKHKEGTATPQESALLQEEIERARRVSALLDEEGGKGEEKIAPADTEVVKKAKRDFNVRTTVRTAVICLICIAVLGALSCGAIFGTALICANGAKTVTQEQALEAAKAALIVHVPDATQAEVIVSEVEEELDIGTKLIDSVYVYEVSLTLRDYRYEVEVSSKSGYAVITDKEAIKTHSARTEDTHKTEQKPQSEENKSAA